MAYNLISLRYSITDEEFLNLVKNQKEGTDNFSEVLVADLIPPMRLVYRKKYQAMIKANTQFRQFMKSKYQYHLKTYKPEVVRDFCDCLIANKFEAEAENRDSVEQLNDDNLGLTLQDIFAAGTDTTRMTLGWLVLILATYPDIQQKLRDEIDSVVDIGEVTRLEHKSKLNYVQAFVSETLRFRPVVPLGVPHKAIIDSTIAGHPVPKDTPVHLHENAILNDPRHWDKPEEFRPERFLDKNGKHNSRVPAFVAFGIGRRACLGEKLAFTDLVLITCRLLQATRGYEIALPDGPGSVSLHGDIDMAQGLQTVKHKMILRNLTVQN